MSDENLDFFTCDTRKEILERLAELKVDIESWKTKVFQIDLREDALREVLRELWDKFFNHIDMGHDIKVSGRYKIAKLGSQESPTEGSEKKERDYVKDYDEYREKMSPELIPVNFGYKTFKRTLKNKIDDFDKDLVAEKVEYDSIQINRYKNGLLKNTMTITGEVFEKASEVAKKEFKVYEGEYEKVTDKITGVTNYLKKDSEGEKECATNLDEVAKNTTGTFPDATDSKPEEPKKCIGCNSDWEGGVRD